MPFYVDLNTYKKYPDPNYPDKHKWIAERLLALRYELEMQILKDRRPNSLIGGSWNIRAFDGGRSRLDESYHYIAEIIDHFDICAVQEIKPDLGPLKRLMGLLGDNWDYFVTDVTAGDAGNDERMAFLYNRNKVTFRNLIGEIVLPREALIEDRLKLQAVKSVELEVTPEEIEGGIEIPAGEMHMMKRGGDHVMFMGLTAPLEQGAEISVTLTFEKAGDVVIEVPVDLTRKLKAGGDHGAKTH